MRRHERSSTREFSAAGAIVPARCWRGGERRAYGRPQTDHPVAVCHVSQPDSNFCDLLIAGGHDRKNHSEVGSSYIHFNYTPHQDKATPSLLGDVPRVVLLNQPPISLADRCGLVGPCRIGFGASSPAGLVLARRRLGRWNVAATEQNVVTRAITPRPFQAGAYKSVARIVHSI